MHIQMSNQIAYYCYFFSRTSTIIDISDMPMASSQVKHCYEEEHFFFNDGEGKLKNHIIKSVKTVNIIPSNKSGDMKPCKYTTPFIIVYLLNFDYGETCLVSTRKSAKSNYNKNEYVFINIIQLF